MQKLLEDTQGAITEMEDDDTDVDVYGSNVENDDQSEPDVEEHDVDSEDILNLDDVDDTSMSDDDDAVDGMSMSPDEGDEEIEGVESPEQLVADLKDIVSELEAIHGAEEDAELEFGDDESDLEFSDDDIDDEDSYSNKNINEMSMSINLNWPGYFEDEELTNESEVKQQVVDAALEWDVRLSSNQIQVKTMNNMEGMPEVNIVFTDEKQAKMFLDGYSGGDQLAMKDYMNGLRTVSEGMSMSINLNWPGYFEDEELTNESEVKQQIIDAGLEWDVRLSPNQIQVKTMNNMEGVPEVNIIFADQNQAKMFLNGYSDGDQYAVKDYMNNMKTVSEDMNPNNWVPGNKMPGKGGAARGSQQTSKTNLPPGQGAGNGGVGDGENDAEKTAKASKGSKTAKPRGRSGKGQGPGTTKEPLTQKTANTVDITKVDVKLKKEDYKVDLSKEINAIMDTDGALSEAAQTKMAKLFENAVNKKVNKIARVLERKASQSATKALAIRENALVEKVDQYLEYVVSNYVEENQIAIDEGLKNRISDSFLTGLMDLFNEHHVTIPAGKENLVSKLERQIAEKTTKNENLYEKAMKLRRENVILRRDRAINKLSEGLSDVQTSKFKKLSENVEYRNQKQFIQALGIVKSSHFGKRTVTTERREFESLAEQTQPDSMMDKYVAAITRTRK